MSREDWKATVQALLDVPRDSGPENSWNNNNDCVCRAAAVASEGAGVRVHGSGVRR